MNNWKTNKETGNHFQPQAKKGLSMNQRHGSVEPTGTMVGGLSNLNLRNNTGLRKNNYSVAWNLLSDSDRERVLTDIGIPMKNHEPYTIQDIRYYARLPYGVLSDELKKKIDHQLDKINDANLKNKAYAGEPKENKVSDQEAFDDFWQVMGERGGVFDVFNQIGVDLEDALKGITTKDDIRTHEYWHIPPLEVNKATQEKIVKHYGGYNGIKEFMRDNAQWEKYGEPQ